MTVRQPKIPISYLKRRVLGLKYNDTSSKRSMEYPLIKDLLVNERQPESSSSPGCRRTIALKIVYLTLASAHTIGFIQTCFD